MADYFIDSSALVKRYVREIGSVWVTSLFDPASNNEIFVAAILCMGTYETFLRSNHASRVSECPVDSIDNLKGDMAREGPD
jgi:hypothetical protein